MKGKTSSTFIIGIILLIIGVAALAYGAYMFDAAKHSLGNAVGKLFTGKSKTEFNAVVILAGGAITAVVGGYLAFFRRR